jgi:hypothetical protein
MRECVEPTLDYANTQFGHNFYVDATPGTGDLYYGGAWHTWLVGGLGAGGAAIYALDVTNPSYSEGSRLEHRHRGVECRHRSAAPWSANCGNNLGNTFGTPQIKPPARWQLGGHLRLRLSAASRATPGSTSCRSTAVQRRHYVLLPEHRHGGHQQRNRRT